MSIHQPSSALFHSLNRVIYLAEGNAVYFGKPKDSLINLKEHDMACPDGYNDADHWMDLLVQNTSAASPFFTGDGDGESLYSGLGKSMNTRQRLIHEWDNEAFATEVDTSVNEGKERTATGKEKKFSKYNTSWGLQYRILVHRSLKNSRSNEYHQECSYWSGVWTPLLPNGLYRRINSRSIIMLCLHDDLLGHRFHVPGLHDIFYRTRSCFEGTC